MSAANTQVTLTSEHLSETVYRLDGPLRWALGENLDLVRRGCVQPGWRVLDVGAGTGYLTLPLGRAVGPTGEVHCLDFAPQLLDVLARKADEESIKARLVPVVAPAQCTGLPDNYFDAVFCSYTLHEIADAAPAALREMWRVLKPNQRLVLADYRRVEDQKRWRRIEHWYGAQDDGAGDDEIHLRFSLADIERMLEDAGFHYIELATWADFHVHATAIK